MAFSRSKVPLSIRPFLCNLVIVSSFSSKALHLKSHLRSISLVDWLILLPFLLLPDVFLATVSRILLARSSIRWKVIDAGFVGLCLALVTATAAAVEISFSWQTNSEIDWAQSRRFLQDTQGLRVLFSGTREAVIVFVIHALLAKVTGPFLYQNIGRYLRRAAFYVSVLVHDQEKGSIPTKSTVNRTLRHNGLLSYFEYFRRYRWLSYVVPYTTILVFYISGTDVPYKHLAGSLPFTLTGHSQSNGGEFCTTSYETDQRPFPLKHYHRGKASWMDWDFGDQKYQHSNEDVANSDYDETKWWHGLGSPSDYVHYDPKKDPLRISNQESALLEELREVFAKDGVTIKNVMMITLESTRKDVFPLKRSSPIHRNIIQSHKQHETRELHLMVGNLSNNAQILTGESNEFLLRDDEPKKHSNAKWKNLPENMGGINVMGAISSSTYTLKNLLTSHCGVGSVPVAFGEEIHHTPYQPCLPQVLEFLNSRKEHKKSPKGSRDHHHDFRSQQWDTHFMQSVTDQYDNQGGLMRKMGFSNSVARGQLQNPTSKFYPPTEPPTYYFGYPDSQIKPYLRDAIEQAKANSRRFFISHLTATTHHPWVLPETFGESKRYVGDQGASDGNDFNRYLNTIKYGDEWLGEIMDMLEETGVANETLTVMFGDHGFAFREDDTVYSTYMGGHITNFRIPLVFHHPRLPRIHVSVNASTMSVLPTILDLLSASSSMAVEDKLVVDELLNEYEGQSLIRPFNAKQGKRQAWHVSVVAPGGVSLAISSAAYPYRLVMPLCQATQLRFTDLSRDEGERTRMSEWSVDKLARQVKKTHGSEAARWVREAKEVGTWWYWETRRLWNYRDHERLEAPHTPDEG